MTYHNLTRQPAVDKCIIPGFCQLLPHSHTKQHNIRPRALFFSECVFFCTLKGFCPKINERGHGLGAYVITFFLLFAMIQYIEGDIFDSPAQVIVNTVNTVGVMGKGLALAFKKRYPQMFARYKAVCDEHLLTVGKLMLFYEADHWILLFPTKQNWRNPSKLEYLEKGLEKFAQTYDEKHITSIAFPRLGCGNGELDWRDVKPLMEAYLAKLPISVYIYLGNHMTSLPEHREPQKTIEWLRKNAKDMSFGGVKDDLVHVGGMLPYEYVIGGNTYQMTYRDKIICITSTAIQNSLCISNEELECLWNRLISCPIVELNDLNEEEIELSHLLHSLNYLSDIRVYNARKDAMVNGYQLNQGLGRTFSFN